MENNHNYNQPAHGTTDWHIPLNENFDQLDRDVEIRDSEANLNEYAPRKDAKYFATDTTRVFVGNGDSWARLQPSGHDPEFSSIRAKDINGEAHAKEFDGVGLASKVENALAWLSETTDGRGCVRITPKDDGTPWTWDKSLTIDLAAREKGIHIVADPTALIEWPHSGFMLTLEGHESSEFTKSSKLQSRIQGGTWQATGTGLSGEVGFVRGRDLNKTTLQNVVADLDGTGATATFFQLRNHDRWSEMNRVINCDVRADLGVSLYPGYRNANSTSNATSSFQGLQIDGGSWDVDDAAFELYGNVNYCYFRSPQVFMFGDRSTAFALGGNNGQRIYSLPTVIGLKAEEHASSTSAFRIDDSTYDGFYNCPQVLGGHFQDLTNTVTDPGDGSNTTISCFRMTQRLPRVQHYEPDEGSTPASQTAFPTGGGMTADGTIEAPRYNVGSDGAHLYVNGSGEIVAVDDTGNETTLT